MREKKAVNQFLISLSLNFNQKLTFPLFHAPQRFIKLKKSVFVCFQITSTCIKVKTR